MTLAASVNLAILQALANGPKQLSELRGETGLPAQSTLRSQLKRLMQAGAVANRRRNAFPGLHEYELTPRGRGLLSVADVTNDWLSLAPGGPLKLGDDAARAAIRGLAESWSATIIRALAALPLSLTELDGLIASLSYPALERRLATLRLAGLVEARKPDNRRSTPYTVTTWLRHAVGPLCAAIRWERCDERDDTVTFGVLDAEALFLLAIPLLDIPSQAGTSCRLSVEIRGERREHFGGVTVEFRDGRAPSCTTELRSDPDAWVNGHPSGWFTALIDHDESGLELGGSRQLARTILAGLHDILFDARTQSGHGT